MTEPNTTYDTARIDAIEERINDRYPLGVVYSSNEQVWDKRTNANNLCGATSATYCLW